MGWPEYWSPCPVSWSGLNRRKSLKTLPTLFDEALLADLGEYFSDLPGSGSCSIWMPCWSCLKTKLATERPLKDYQTLQTLGYCMSARKAQLHMTTDTYLGFNLHEAKRALSASCKQAILGTPTFLIKEQMQEFLESVGYCWLWVPRFTEIAKHPNDLTEDPEGKLPWNMVGA